MNHSKETISEASLIVENIGGIDKTEVSFSPGITVLAGRNATNRTSLLQALMAALGSDDASVKGDATEGHVELTLNGTTYTRTLRRTNGGISTDGGPLLNQHDAEVADLFAFLLESNEARQAVAQHRDLRELIMRPVDTDTIQTEITELERDKRHLDDELEELKQLEHRLPNLEQKRTRLERQIEDRQDELDAIEAEIEAADAKVKEARDEQSELDRKFDDLQKARSTLEEIRLDIDSEEKSLDALQDEQNGLETELTDLAESPERDPEKIEIEIERLRNRRQSLDSTLNELQSVIQFNEEMFGGTNPDVTAALRDDQTYDTTSALTDQLLEDGEEVICWTCGSEVATQQLEATLDRLRTLRQQKLDERNSVKDEITDLEDTKQEYETIQHERDQLETRITEVETEIQSRKTTLTELRQRRDDLQDEIATLEQEIEELEVEEQTELLDLHKEANQLEFELGRLESDREDVAAEIDSIETQLEKREQLEEQRAEIQSNLEELRSRIDRIEANAIEQFNEHMAAVLDILDYANLERIWIERTEQDVREGRRKVKQSSFELHIVRQTEAGTTYEDTIDHLSESEREVTGLIFALAGYLVHDVYEILPCLLLDSLEAIDAERIAKLVDYFHEYADYLVVALLPEDANALDSSYQRISNI